MASLQQSPNVAKILRRFFPLFAISAVLPFLMFFAMNQVDYDINSRAGQESALRVWFEPASVVLSPGETISLQLVANFENEENQLHTTTVTVPTVRGLTVSPNEVSYTPPFRGKVVLGEVEVRAVNIGEYTLEIPTSGVTTSTEDIEIITSPASIDVSSQ